jgi:hypothetical protein
VRSTSTSAAIVVPAINNRIIVTMNGILDDALSGLLLLREGIDSNNDSKDHCTTQSSNDSSTTPPSNDSNATHTFDDSNDLLTALDEFDEGLTSSRYSLALLEDGDDESENEA